MWLHISTPRQRKLIKWNQKEKKISLSEDLAPTFLLPSIKPLSPIFFLFDNSQKQIFGIAFDLNCRFLANNHNVEEVNLNFATCQCVAAIKANREWQQELWNNKLVCMVEAILLVAAIFWDPNFILCLRHTLNLVKKLGLKTRKLKTKVIKERVEQIWANKIIERLNVFFINNLE